MKQSILFPFLKWSTFFVFLGRGWQHIYWDAPFRTLLWDEAWMSGLVSSLLGMDWNTYVTSSSTDAFIVSWIDATGWFYILCAIMALLIDRIPKMAIPLIGLGGINLFILALLYCKEHFFFIGQFFEYTLQWGSPFFLLLLYKERISYKQLLFGLKVAIALTFTCHGLYAVGYYPRPGKFIQMTMTILGTNKEASVIFLNIAGILDFVLSVLIFLPRRFALIGLGYAAFWGLATTAARVWANYIPEFWQDSLLTWTHESIMRMPHFMVPLAVMLWMLNKDTVYWKSLLKRREKLIVKEV